MREKQVGHKKTNTDKKRPKALSYKALEFLTKNIDNFVSLC